MFDSYKKQALAAYEKRTAEDTLSPRLRTPTPAGLRDECYDVYEEKERPKEDATLRLFFGPIEQGADYSQRIRNFDIDKFRPLATFLNNTAINTNQKNTRLLLWLVDLERKPLAVPSQGDGAETTQIPVVTHLHQEINENELNEGQDIRNEQEGESPSEEFISVQNNVEYGGLEIITSENEVEKERRPEEDSKDIGVSQPKNESNDETANNDEVDKEKASKLFKLTTYKVTVSIIAIFIIGVAYGFWKNNKDKSIREPFPTEKYMYWTGLHYEPTSGNDKVDGRLIVPLNQEQLVNQQRITLPDTLTNYSLGRVWYGKINGKPQFYTDSGTNPIDTTRRLLPVTTYMLNKYVSYDRYLLNVVIWSVSLVVLFSLLVILAYKSFPKDAFVKYYLQRFKKLIRPKGTLVTTEGSQVLKT